MQKFWSAVNKDYFDNDTCSAGDDSLEDAADLFDLTFNLCEAWFAPPSENVNEVLDSVKDIPGKYVVFQFFIPECFLSDLLNITYQFQIGNLPRHGFNVRVLEYFKKTVK